MTQGYIVWVNNWPTVGKRKKTANKKELCVIKGNDLSDIAKKLNMPICYRPCKKLASAHIHLDPKSFVEGHRPHERDFTIMELTGTTIESPTHTIIWQKEEHDEPPYLTFTRTTIF